MAVQAQFGGFADEQMRALGDYGYINCLGVVSGAQSELTCNASGVLMSSRKRGREADCSEQYASSPLAAALKSSRVADSATVSTSSSAQDAAELCLRQGAAELDALVRAGCERMRAGMVELARKRQCQELVRLAAGAAERRLREKDAELGAARRRAAELEARLRQAAAESQAWCGLARGHEAVAAELRAALDRHLLLLRSGAAAPAAAVEGFGESGCGDDDDAQSCCFFEAKDTAPASKWACKACGEGEASVLLLPCRHLCLCKSCEPRTDACPVCLAVKNASIHVAPI